MDIEEKKSGLHINAGKTKIMALGKGILGRQNHCEIGTYSFEVVKSFSYLGSVINDSLNEEEEIGKRIAAGNRAYFSISKLMKSKLISSTTKFMLYKPCRPVVTYGGET